MAGPVEESLSKRTVNFKVRFRSWFSEVGKFPDVATIN